MQKCRQPRPLCGAKRPLGVVRFGDKSQGEQDVSGEPLKHRCSGCAPASRTTSSKKGISAHQLHRTLKVTYKTAWFMAHRLRAAMREGHFVMGGKEKNKHASKRKHAGTGAPVRKRFSL
jgi:hypothetical protein